MAVFAEKTEYPDMPIFVGADVVENHPAKHLLYMCRIPVQESGKRNEVYIIYCVILNQVFREEVANRESIGVSQILTMSDLN